MRCENCGTDNRDDARFCRKCGLALGDKEYRTPENDGLSTPKRSFGRKRGVIVLAVVTVLLIVLIGIAVGIHLKTKASPGGNSPDSAITVYYSDDLYYQEPESNHFAEDADTGIDFVDNEVIVYCGGSKPVDEVLRSAGIDNYEIVGHVAATGSYQVRLPQSMDYPGIEETCRKLKTIEGVVDCSPNYGMVAEPTERTDDPAWTESAEEGKSSKTWGLESIKASEAWDIIRANSDTHVGMIEYSQFYVRHEDLDGAIVETLPSSDGQFNIKDGWGWFADEDDHGTHVAGIIGAESNDAGSVGVAYGASLYGYSYGGKDSKDSNGNPKMTAGYGVEVGLAYLVDSCECSIINISVQWRGDVQRRASSGNGEDAVLAQWEMQQYSAELAASIRALIRSGHDEFIICKSADNDGTKGLANWDLFGCIFDEEVASRILIVGSLSEKEDGGLEVSKSSKWASSCGTRVDVLAPGSDIYNATYSTTDEGDASIPFSDYGYKSGTSRATPMVAGVAALVKSADPELKGDQIKRIICETASGSYADETGVSRGQVDAEAAVKKASLAKNGIPRKLITSFHITYNSKKFENQSYEEWVIASYDDMGHITHKEITGAWPRGYEGEIGYALTYEYDASGRVTKVYGTEGESYQSLHPDYTPGTVSWDITYGDDGRQVHANGVEYSSERFIDDTYGADGSIETRDYLIRTGQVLQNGNLTFSYDADGRITKQSAKVGANGDQSKMSGYGTNVSYDQDNRIRYMDTLDSEAKLFSTYTYVYDDEGHMTLREHAYMGGNDDTETNSQSYSYDENGHLMTADQKGYGRWDDAISAHATFVTDEEGSVVSASIEGKEFSRTYEIEYVAIATPRGEEPVNAVDLTDLFSPELYNELWVSHANLDATPFDESAFLRENRRWLELHE